MREKIIAIVGQTATGKTSLAIEIALALGGEVVSADSRQVYRGLNIGSGKVTKEEARGIPHHLINVADPRNVFSAADFVRLGRATITDIHARDRVPIIVGGTGFYVDALVGRIALADVPKNEPLRAELSAYPVPELKKKLATLDPDALRRMDSENPVRLIRAIEIATALGKVELKKGEEVYDTLWLGLTLPAETLKERIQARLTARLDMGMLNEAKTLHKNGLSHERMEELGLEYRFMARHLKGDITFDEMRKQLLIEIGKYAKRQMSWFKKNKDIHWIAPEDTKKAIKLASEFFNI